MSDDPYQVLGVPRGATPEQIRRAYRRLVLLHHPDRNPGDAGATARFLRVSQAYQTLTTGGRRAPEPPDVAHPPEKKSDEDEPIPRRDTWSDGTPIHYPTAEDIAHAASGRKRRDHSKTIRRVLLFSMCLCFLYFWLLGFVRERGTGVRGAVGPEWYRKQNERYY